MPSNRYPLIAKEGWLVLMLLASLYLVAEIFISSSLALIFLLLFLFAIILFRDPFRIIPPMPLAIISPVQGKVISIDDLENVWLERPAKRIRIKMSLLDVFSLRSPTEGKVMDQWSKSKKADMQSAEYAYWIKTDEDDDVVTVLHMSKPSWLYRIYLQSGHRIGQGQRCGYLYLGSTVDVFLPSNVKLMVENGQRVQSGSSILANIIHDTPVSVIPAASE